jgi:transposase
MERYTIRQVNRALVLEQLVQRLDQGEAFAHLCQELSLSLSRDYLPELRKRYRQGGATWVALVDHRHGHVYKVTAERRAWLRQQKEQNPALTQHQLAQRFQDEFQVSLSQSQVSNILRAEGLALPGGQRFHAQENSHLPVERAGVFFPSGRRVADGRVEHGDGDCPDAQRDRPEA